MSVLKSLVAAAAIALAVSACSEKEETVVVDETPPAPDASAMSGTAPTTVNPTDPAMGTPPPVVEVTPAPPAEMPMK